MAELSGVEALQSEIEKSKDKLRGYNENIKKLTGRDPSRPRVRRFLSGEGGEREEDAFPGRAARGRGRLFGLARRSIMEDSGPPAKRRIVGGAFSRLGPAPVPARRKEREDSPYEEELPHKLSVHSSVVATSREAKNRKEILQEQTKDKEGMQRNRRMFGLLLGTLNKFKTESKTLETKEVQRKKIEEKLEENAEKEKRKFKMETKLLMEEMHLEQSKISRLQQKMEMVQEHSEREEEMKKLKNFIVTKTKPRIFWRPRQMPAMLENKLKESKKVVDGMLQEGQDRLEKEIKELMERENKREERIKMRLREDGLLEDGEGEGGEGADEESKDDGAGVRPSTGRTVVEVKEENDGGNFTSDRLFRHVGDKGSDDEEVEREKDTPKKSRRTVIVEHERDESSESESDAHSNTEGKTGGLGSRDISRSHPQLTENNKEKNNESGSSSEEENEDRTKLQKQNNISTENVGERGEQMRSSDEEDDDANKETVAEKNEESHKKDRAEERHRNKNENDSVERGKRRKNDDRRRSSDQRDKDRTVGDRDRGSRERPRSSRDMSRSSEERDRSSRDRDRSGRHRDRSGRDKEERRDREGKKSSRSDSRKHSSHHRSKARKRSDDSDESDVEVKKEKEEDKSRSKDRYSTEDRERTETKSSDNGNHKHTLNQSGGDGQENDESGSEQNNSA